MAQDNKKIYLTGVGIIVTLVLGMIGTMWAFAQDRQDVAVALESLAVASQQQRSDITDIKGTLRMMADQNASVLVLQHQVAELQRRLDKVEGP